MSNRYYDTQMLALAHPAQYKNELQAAGDGFMNMYSNYLKNRLNKNEVLTSDLGLEFMNATQDDRIKQAKLDTNIKQNQADLSALELNTAKQTQKDTIEQTRLKTLSDSEKLKQEQFATKTQPEIFNMQKSLNNAQINNLNSSIAERNFSMFLKKHAFNENERATNSSTLFQNFLNDNNLQGDDNAKFAYVKHLDDEYNYALNNPLLNDSQRAKRLSEIYKTKLEFAKYLPQTAQANSIVAQGFNSFSSKGGNGVNGGRNNGVSNVDLAMFNKAQEQNKAIEQEFLNNASKIDKITEVLRLPAATNFEEQEKARQELVKLQERQKELENIKNQNKAYINSNTSGIYTMLKDTLARQGFSKPEEEIQEMQDLLLLSKGLNDIYDVLENGKGKDFNVGYTGNIGRFFTRVGGNSHPIDLLENRTKTFMKIYQSSGAKLKSQYEDIRSVFPDYTGWWQSKGKVASDLRDIEESIRNQINNKLSAYNNESKELIKSLVDNIYTSKYSLKATQ